MKHIALVLIISILTTLIMNNCKPKDTAILNLCQEQEQLVRETADLAIRLSKAKDSIQNKLEETQRISNENDFILNHKIDSLRVINNKLGKELLHDKQVLQNARYYLNIANKNASQQKFLRGWMNRALNQ